MSSAPATAAAPAAAPTSKKPDETSAFKQQRMAAWQPVMSPPWVIGTFLVLGIAFIPIGAAIIAGSDSIVEVKERYDHLFSCQTLGTGCTHQVPFSVPDKMEPPIFIYYQLDNFYQNHRRYAKSKSDLQLAGQMVDAASMSDCDPLLHPGTYKSIGDTTVTLNAGPGGGAPPETVALSSLTYNPCGLVAWSMFNDSFQLLNSTGHNLCDGSAFDAIGDLLPGAAAQSCEKKGISWPSDPGVKYNAPPNVQDANFSQPKYLGHGGFRMQAPNLTRAADRAAYHGWYVGEDEHAIPDAQDLDLMVWMRLASLSSFRKLYRKITVTLEPGQYTMVIQNRFPVGSFNGKKSFVLTTSSWLGGKNHVLGGLYIATGMVCALLGIAFLAKWWRTPRRVGAL